MTTSTYNPLLIGKGLPPFQEIIPAHVEPGMNSLLTELENELTELENNLQPTWSGLVEPLEEITDRIKWSWGIVGHLMGVKNSPELRAAHDQVQPQVVKFYNRFNQSKALYQGFKGLRDHQDWETLQPAQKRIIERAIQDAELSGVALEGEQKEKFNTIELELAELCNKFSNNVLDATKAYSI
ncbi:MAG: M3 family metallopeptidase, partial [Microcoleaceae cyanobacterium]